MSRLIALESVLTCPHCGHRMAETMPLNACRYFHECLACRKVMRPKPGDCCVFCSYGSEKCPPVQAEGRCCAGEPEGQLDQLGCAAAEVLK